MTARDRPIPRPSAAFVPAHWHDTIEWQASQAEHERGVTILNKRVPEAIQNLPFLHIQRVGARDGSYLGGLRKAIRLVKNVKNDADNETVASHLSSFDIAGLMYHANENALKAGYINELYILSEARRFLDWCWTNKDQARRLITPDGKRAVLDSDTKMDALLTISCEMDDLAKQVAKEQSAFLNIGASNWADISLALAHARVPAAA